MTRWLSISEARQAAGLRLLVLRGLPSPWSLAARALFDARGLEHACVYVAPQDPPGALRDWTGQTSFPVAVLEHERPRSGWAEILLLANRLDPEHALIPQDPAQRADVFGLAHEMCGEQGLGWCRRLLGIAPRAREAPDDPGVRDYLHKYTSGAIDESAAKQRVIDVLRLLDTRLAEGNGFLVGDRLSAADLHWAAFSNLIVPLDDALMPLVPEIRAGFTTDDPDILAAFTPRLRAHRNDVYERRIGVPVDV